MESRYIAAQGKFLWSSQSLCVYTVSTYSTPLIETIDHFWRMIWEYGVETIVMLTRCVELSRVSLPYLSCGVCESRDIHYYTGEVCPVLARVTE